MDKAGGSPGSDSGTSTASSGPCMHLNPGHTHGSRTALPATTAAGPSASSSCQTATAATAGQPSHAQTKRRRVNTKYQTWERIPKAQRKAERDSEQRSTAQWMHLGLHPRGAGTRASPGRTKDGRFALHPPPGDFAPATGRETLRGRQRGKPYYLSVGESDLLAGRLPKIARAMDAAGSRLTAAFGAPPPGGATGAADAAGPSHGGPIPISPSPTQGRVEALLDHVGLLLCERARVETFVNDATHVAEARTLHGSEAFQAPLAGSGETGYGRGGCMDTDVSNVASARHSSLLASGYTSIVLANVAKSRGAPCSCTVSELAHRIVVWAMYGPPPASIRHPEAMHLCNNQRCLNPLHIVWGEKAENTHRDQSAALQAGVRRRLDQRAY